MIARLACHRAAFLTSSAVVGGRRRNARGSGRYRILYIDLMADLPIRPGHDGDAAADLHDGVLDLIQPLYAMHAARGLHHVVPADACRAHALLHEATMLDDDRRHAV